MLNFFKDSQSHVQQSYNIIVLIVRGSSHLVNASNQRCSGKRLQMITEKNMPLHKSLKLRD